MISCFTFIDKNGENIHIDSDSLRRWCLGNKELEIFSIPLQQKLAEEFLLNNVISMTRVLELAKRDKLDPIIMAKDGTFSPDNGGPNVMLVDGHHRYALAVAIGRETIPGYMLEVEQWRPFELKWVPKMTMEQLIRMPLTKRDY